MCQFCVEHGEGERWYLNASNYAYDLTSDARRRGYIIDFVRGFGTTRERALRWMQRLDALPTPVSRAGKELLSRRMRAHHFGQPLPIEECDQVLRLATSITVIPCICRMHTPGKKADEVCILVTTQPIEPYLQQGFSDYADGPDLDDFHTVTADEAMSLMSTCESQGLMHSIWTFQTPFTAAICNCNLESGCMAMKLTAGYGMKMMWRGEWIAQVDAENCTACGACAKACPFDAFVVSRRKVEPDPARCWGCGVCRSHCPKGALSLIDRREVPAVAALW